MKKRIVGLFILIICLSGCSSTISAGDVSKISLGMSQEKVEELLGSPDIKTTDRDELTTKYDSISTLYASQIEFDDTEDNKNRGYEEYSETFSAIGNKENVELYIYNTKKDSEKIYIYFINEKVSFFYSFDTNS